MPARKKDAKARARAPESNRPPDISKYLTDAKLISPLFGRKGPIVSRRPTAARYAQLVAELEKAKAALQEGQNDLAVALNCLVAVVSFLDADFDVKAAALTQPLNTLAVAIRDLLEGAQPTLLFDRPRRRGRPTGGTFQVVRGVIAALADLLITYGEPSDLAGRCVADELRRAGVAGPKGTITSRQVLRWRHDIGGASPALTETTYKSIRAKFDSIPPPHLADRKSCRQFCTRSHRLIHRRRNLRRSVNAGAKMHRRAGVIMHRDERTEARTRGVLVGLRYAEEFLLRCRQCEACVANPERTVRFGIIPRMSDPGCRRSGCRAAAACSA